MLPYWRRTSNNTAKSMPMATSGGSRQLLNHPKLSPFFTVGKRTEDTTNLVFVWVYIQHSFLNEAWPSRTLWKIVFLHLQLPKFALKITRHCTHCFGNLPAIAEIILYKKRRRGATQLMLLQSSVFSPCPRGIQWLCASGCIAFDTLRLAALVSTKHLQKCRNYRCPGQDRASMLQILTVVFLMQGCWLWYKKSGNQLQWLSWKSLRISCWVWFCLLDFNGSFLIFFRGTNRHDFGAWLARSPIRGLKKVSENGFWNHPPPRKSLKHWYVHIQKTVYSINMQTFDKDYIITYCNHICPKRSCFSVGCLEKPWKLLGTSEKLAWLRELFVVIFFLWRKNWKVFWADKTIVFFPINQ